MTATYSNSLADSVSKVRFELGDTDITKAELQDEEINHFLVAKSLSEDQTAAACAWALYAKYSRLADVTMDDQLTRYSHVASNWLALAKRLESRSTPDAPGPADGSSYSGGLIVTGIGDCRGPLDDCCPPWGWRPC